MCWPVVLLIAYSVIMTGAAGYFAWGMVSAHLEL